MIFDLRVIKYEYLLNLMYGEGEEVVEDDFKEVVVYEVLF